MTRRRVWTTCDWPAGSRLWSATMTCRSRSVCAATPDSVMINGSRRLQVGKRTSMAAMHHLSERARIHGTGAAQLRRLVRCQLVAKCLVGRAVPGLQGALLYDVAEVDAIRRRDHTAGHGIALVADVGPRPRPVAPLGTGSAGRVDARPGAWETQVHAQLSCHVPRRAEVALDALRVVLEQGLGLHKLAHGPVLCRQA